jgi:hypothetical protein
MIGKNSSNLVWRKSLSLSKYVHIKSYKTFTSTSYKLTFFNFYFFFFFFFFFLRYSYNSLQKKLDSATCNLQRVLSQYMWQTVSHVSLATCHTRGRFSCCEIYNSQRVHSVHVAIVPHGSVPTSRNVNHV